MVNEIWKREFNTSFLRVEHNKSYVFVNCLWQQKPEVSLAFVLYRIIMFLLFLSILICSILNVKDEGGIAPFIKWPIYLTNWGFTICTVQFFWGMVLTMKQYVRERKHGQYVGVKKGIRTSYKVYWVLNTTAIVMAVGITMCYWATVHDPDVDKLTTMSCLVHIANALGMLLDFSLVAHPFRLLHCYWPFSFTTIYVLFTLIYFELGGTSPQGKTYIYPTMNWNYPRKNLLSVLSGLIFVAVLHTVIWLLYMLKRFLYGLCMKDDFPDGPHTSSNREAIPMDIVV